MSTIQNSPILLIKSAIRICNVKYDASFYSATNSGKSGNWSAPVWPHFNSNISKFDIEIVTNTEDSATPIVGEDYHHLNYLTNVYIRTGPWYFNNYNRFTYFATKDSGTRFGYLVDANNDDAEAVWQIVNKDNHAKTGEVLFEDSVLLKYTHPTSGDKYYLNFEPDGKGFEIDMTSQLTPPPGTVFQLLYFRPV